jgi:hypothetical protein
MKTMHVTDLSRRAFIRNGLLTATGFYAGTKFSMFARGADAGSAVWPAIQPNWLKTARIFALEQWWPPYWPHLEVDWDRALHTMKRLNLDTLQANALTKWAFYQTGLIAKHPELGRRDILRESSNFCQKHGFRMIMYTLFGHAMPISTQLSKKYGPALFEPLIKWKANVQPRHQVNVPLEFRERYTRWHFGGEPYVAHCVFAMERWLLEHVGELADRYEYQAAWVDGSAGAGGGWANDGLLNVCCCPVCQAAYADDFKRPIPDIKEINDPRLLDLRRWVQRRLDAVMEKTRKRLTKDFSMPMVGNVAGGGGEITFHPPYARHLAGGLFEHAPDTLDLVRLLGQSRHLTATAIHYPDVYDPFPRRVTSGWEVENKGLIILSFDGTPYLAEPGKYYYDDQNDAPAKRIFDFMQKAKPLLERQRHDAYAAIVSPPFYARGGQHNRFARGWTRLMLDAHILPSELPSHLTEQVDACGQIPVILVPDVQTISDKGIEAVVRFAEKGGGVYLSGNVGAMDENRQARPPERLAQLLDLVKWNGDQAAWKRRANFDSAFSPNNRRQSYDVYHRVADPGMGFPVPDAFRIGPSELGDTVPGDSWKACAWAMPTDKDEPLMTTLAVKSVGQGRMIYAGSPFESQYMDRRSAELRTWLKALLLWLGQKPLPVHVEAPTMLQLGSSRLEGGGRLVYLVNQSNDIQPKREDWWEMMKVWDRPLPIGKVSLAVAASKIETIYGPSPDRVEKKDDQLVATWDDFCDHAVIHAVI